MRASSLATYIETRAWIIVTMVIGHSASQSMQEESQLSVKKVVDMAPLADREDSREYARSKSLSEQTNSSQNHHMAACLSNLHKDRDHLSIHKRGHHTINLKAIEEAKNNNLSERTTICESTCNDVLDTKMLCQVVL